MLSFLLEGEVGCGKTALASFLGMQSQIPFIKRISAEVLPHLRCYFFFLYFCLSSFSYLSGSCLLSVVDRVDEQSQRDQLVCFVTVTFEIRA